MGEEDAAFDLLCDEYPIFDVKVMAIKGAINRGIPKEEALKKYGLTEKEYDDNVERVMNS